MVFWNHYSDERLSKFTSRMAGTIYTYAVPRPIISGLAGLAHTEDMKSNNSRTVLQLIEIQADSVMMTDEQ
jgi:hypothetical protein